MIRPRARRGDGPGGMRFLPPAFAQDPGYMFPVKHIGFHVAVRMTTRCAAQSRPLPSPLSSERRFET
jgi:hypothetical protein